LLRLRFHLINRGRDGVDRPLLAEDLALLAFEGAPGAAVWLPPERARELMDAGPTDNLAADQARHQLARIIEALPQLQAKIDETAAAEAEQLLAAHRRVRRADTRRGVDRGLKTLRVEPHPADVLGLFLLTPDLRARDRSAS
jgi:hypothetical protein